MALLKAINVDQVVQQAYFGRGTKAKQVYPVNQMPDAVRRPEHQLRHLEAEVDRRLAAEQREDHHDRLRLEPARQPDRLEPDLG